MNNLYELRKENSDDYLAFRCDDNSNIVIEAGNEIDGFIVVKMDSVAFDETCDILDLHDDAKYSPDTFGRSKITFKKDCHMLTILLQNAKYEVKFELTMLNFKNIVKRIHRGLIAREAAKLMKSYLE